MLISTELRFFCRPLAGWTQIRFARSRLSGRATVHVGPDQDAGWLSAFPALRCPCGPFADNLANPLDFLLGWACRCCHPHSANPRRRCHLPLQSIQRCWQWVDAAMATSTLPAEGLGASGSWRSCSPRRCCGLRPYGSFLPQTPPGAAQNLKLPLSGAFISNRCRHRATQALRLSK